MKTKYLLLAAAFVAVAVSGFAVEPAVKKTRVEVTFDQPEKFTDLKNSWMGSDRDRDDFLALFKDFLELEVPRYIADGQTLAITFTNIDLAGDFEPERGIDYSSVRIVKDIYPPRMSFTYKLVDASGAVLKEGQEKMIDMSFQMTASLFDAQDTLRYEKSMLREWMRSTFPKPKKAKAKT